MEATSVIRRVRRRLTRDGYVLLKPRPGSALAASVGPYAITDPVTGQIVAAGLTLEDLVGESHRGVEDLSELAAAG